MAVKERGAYIGTRRFGVFHQQPCFFRFVRALPGLQKRCLYFKCVFFLKRKALKTFLNAGVSLPEAVWGEVLAAVSGFSVAK